MNPIATFPAYDRSDVELYSHALDMYAIIDDLRNRFRAISKHGDGTETIADFYEREFYQIVDERFPELS